MPRLPAPTGCDHPAVDMAGSGWPPLVSRRSGESGARPADDAGADEPHPGRGWGRPRNRIPDPTAAGDATKSATTDQSFPSPAADPATDAVPDIVPAAGRIADCPLRAAAGPGGDPARPARGEARCHHPGGGTSTQTAGCCASPAPTTAPSIDGVTGPTPGRPQPRPRMPEHRPAGGVAPATDRARAAPLMDLPPAHGTCARARRRGGPSQPHAGRSPCSLQCSTSMWTSSVKRAHRSDHS